jgi:peptide deformylase
MAVRKILTIGKHEKTLRSKSEPVHKINREIKALFVDLRDTMAEHPAIGLAAPQIGVLKRVFIVKLGYSDDEDDEDTATDNDLDSAIAEADAASESDLIDDETDDSDDDGLPTLIMVNPEIVIADDKKRGYDACLSVPGMMGYTSRPTTIRVKFVDEFGQKQDREYSGWDARVIQHELDHLDGVLFMDRLDSLADLYVFVTDDDGNRKPISYLEVTRDAKKIASPGAPPRLIATPERAKRPNPDKV